MHTDLNDESIARRLRAAEDEASQAPYDWAEFQRRRQYSRLSRIIERNRPVAIAAAVVAALVVTAVPFLQSSDEVRSNQQVGSSQEHASGLVPADTAARTQVSDRQDQARTRAIEGWLAGLPQNRVIVRVGTHAAVSSLQDQIAALDDLMSTERVRDAQPGRIEALERQREQLVSSLAQVQYAEMLASATP